MLATRDAVIPYAVGVDIACRMKMSVLDIRPPPSTRSTSGSALTDAIEGQTRFGVGMEFRGRERRDHPVMDMDWNGHFLTRDLRDKAWAQLGTSGSGNHFVEFGLLTVSEGAPRGIEQHNIGGSHARWDLPAGTYLALLSHSGSRGTGAAIYNHFSALARNLRPSLPKEQSHLRVAGHEGSQAGQGVDRDQ